MQRIALYQGLKAGTAKRGPQIFFPHFFKEYQSHAGKKFETYYFVKTQDKEKIRAELVGVIGSDKNIIFLKAWNNRFKKYLERLQLIYLLVRYKINIFQALAYDSPDEQLDQFKTITWFKKIKNIKTVVTITYNGIPTAFKHDYDARFEQNRKRMRALFGGVPMDGIYSWYDDFIPFVEESDIFCNKPLVRCISSRFCNIEKYHPLEKRKEIVWASALVNYKHPMMFVDAVVKLVKDHPESLNGWKVIILGNGPEEDRIKELIATHHLPIELRSGLNDISPILNYSMCYVSTQEIDNFPSLAMNEAMAAGNMIIARDCGRTYLFTEHDKNGWLMKEDNSSGLADALYQMLSQPEKHNAMMKHSRVLCETVHTPPNFIREIEAFWAELLKM
jgi:glycosyltransferase involved in cell wall biosynthesis